MKAKLAAAIAALDRLVNYFIPADIAADRDARNRAHVFLVSHILGPFIGSVVPISIYLLDPSPGYDVAVLAVSIVAFWVFPFVLRAGVPYNPLALVSIENLIFCIFWSCYFYGGVTSPTLPWVVTIPLLAFFYLGSQPKLRVMVFGLIFANFAGFYGVHLLGGVPPADAYGVATFYDLFSTRPRDPTVVHVCDDIACICAGGLGNLIDRVGQDGYVTDFLNVGVGSVRTGIFNVADLILMLGMAALLFIRPRTPAMGRDPIPGSPS